MLRKYWLVRCSADMADPPSASTSSVTMHHTASRSLVAEWHIVTCHLFKVLWVWSVAKAAYRHCQIPRFHSAVASQRWQHERCGPACGSRLAGASCWISLRLRLGLALAMHCSCGARLLQPPVRFYITPHFRKYCAVVVLELHFVHSTASRLCRLPK